MGPSLGLARARVQAVNTIIFLVSGVMKSEKLGVFSKRRTLNFTFLEVTKCTWKFDSCSFRTNLTMAGKILNMRLNLVNNLVNRSSSIIDIWFHFHKYIHLQTVFRMFGMQKLTRLVSRHITMVDFSSNRDF